MCHDSVFIFFVNIPAQTYDLCDVNIEITRTVDKKKS